MTITEILEEYLEQGTVHDTPGDDAVDALVRVVPELTGTTAYGTDGYGDVKPEMHEQISALLEHPDLAELNLDVLRYVAGRLDAVGALGTTSKLRSDAKARTAAAEEARASDWDESAEDESEEIGSA